MFSVYKITNKINNMCYIGSSIRVEKRWAQHRNAAFNENNACYNYPLYQDFRSFGLENFSFEILADDFNSIEEMEDFEQAMIDYYDSLAPKGYNQTRWTHSNNIASENMKKHIEKISCKCAKVDIKENILETYSSYHDAARKNFLNGENYASNIRQACKNEISSVKGYYFRDLDKEGKIISYPFKSPKGKKPLICISVLGLKDKYFNSISEAAKELNSDRSSISKCIKGDSRYSIIKGYIIREIDIYGNIIHNNIDIEQRIAEYNQRNPIINGEQHSIKEWCEIYQIKVPTVNARIRKGWDPISAITTPTKGDDA